MSILTPTEATLREAGSLIRAGSLVAFPTETVYGLGADATNDRAVAHVYEVKGRPRFNPLIVHVANVAMAQKLAEFDRRAQYLVRRLWPGPLTLVLKKRPDCPVGQLATAGLPTIAVRMPDHPVALRLIALAERPLVGPSANKSGGLSPTTAEHVEAQLGRSIAMVLDGGPCAVGIESTVIDLTGDAAVLLRPGAVSADTISASIGPLGPPPKGDKPRGPGMLASHYAPRLPLRLDPDEAEPGEALLSFGSHGLDGFAAEINLSPKGDLAEAAARLFSALHELDRPEFTGIAAMTVPERGLGVAINDRLRRAAAPRG